MRKYQRLLSKSYYPRLLAVRRVSQDNQGKKTAGMDGIKNLPPMQRLNLVDLLNTRYLKASPTRRVWIPKPGRDEKRPLGIPTMYDRALQALVKLGRSPEWEARFEPNSYGFRPGRSIHDAIEAIYVSIKQKPKYVLDADISKCMSLINHKNKCAFCGLTFRPTDLMEVDYVIPRSKGGSKTYRNKEVLHRHCHDTKTASDKETYPEWIGDSGSKVGMYP